MLRYALIAAAGAVLITGCQRQEELAEAREDVAEARQDLQEERQDLNQAQRAERVDEGATVDVEGRIAEVTEESVQLQTSRGDQLELKLGPNPIDFSGQPIRITELKEGSEVRASYSEFDGQKVIKAIEVTGQGEPQQMQEQQPGGELNEEQIDPSQQMQEQQ